MLMMHGSVGLRWVRSGLARAADAHDPGPVGPDPAWQGLLMLMMHGSVGLSWRRSGLAGAADAHDAPSVLAGADLAWQELLMLMIQGLWAQI